MFENFLMMEDCNIIEKKFNHYFSTTNQIFFALKGYSLEKENLRQYIALSFLKL